MSNDLALYLSKQLLWHALIITAPVVLAALICGFIVSIFQVITQIQDATVSFVPKVLAVVLMLVLCGEWMLHSLTDFTYNIILHIPESLKS